MEKKPIAALNALLKSTDEQMEQTIRERDDEVKKFTARIRAEEDRKRRAEKNAAEALGSDDESQFLKQSSEAQSAEALIGLIEKRRSEAQSAELITPEEYQSKVEEILTAFEAEKADANERLRELAEQMQKIGVELADAQSRTNNTLRDLQHKLNQDRQSSHRNQYGTFYKSADPHSVNVSGLIQWAMKACEDFQYSGTLVRSSWNPLGRK